jgi:hypothetical protein
MLTAKNTSTSGKVDRFRCCAPDFDFVTFLVTSETDIQLPHVLVDCIQRNAETVDIIHEMLNDGGPARAVIKSA